MSGEIEWETRSIADMANQDALRVGSLLYDILSRPSPWYWLWREMDEAEQKAEPFYGYPIPPWELKYCIHRILHANDPETIQYNRNGFRYRHELEVAPGIWSAAPMYDVIETDPDFERNLH